MRRVLLSYVCGLSLVLVLAGCETLTQIVPWLIDRDGPDEPGEPAAQVTIEHATTFLPIDRARVLSATTQGFRIIDVRDASRPRVVGSFPLASEKLELYRVGNHVILLASHPRGYQGERVDVPLRRQAQSASGSLFNIDIRDPSNPTLVNELEIDDLPRHSILRRAADGGALFLLPTIWNGERYQSRVDRYELRAGVLERTAQLTLDGAAEAMSATPDRLLAATVGEDDNDLLSTVTALDITQRELSVAFTASFAGGVGPRTQLWLTGDQLRVLYFENDTRAASIATFQLSAAPPAQPSGVCRLGATSIYDLDASLFSESARDFFVSNAHEPAQLEQLALDASGNCPERSAFGPGSRSYALQAPEPGRLLASGASDVRLYDTEARALIGSASLSAPFAGSGNLLQLREPAQAADGTPEPTLASVLSSGPEHKGGRFELLTLSDATLTARGKLDVRGDADQIALFGRSLLALSSTGLTTFDMRDLDAPLELGQLDLAERYLNVFGVGEHIVRIRQHPWVLPPGERGRTVQDDLEVLPRSLSATVASLPVESEGQWLQLGTLLVNTQLSIAAYGSESERKAQVALQAYDLSDPAAPRKAGALSTTEIEAEWTPGHFYEPSVSFLTVGDAIVIPQRKRSPDVHIRQCWKTVDYDVCANHDDPSCTFDVYTGTLLCRTLDAEPEVCTVYDLKHCTSAGCESLTELPAGIPSVEDGCNEYDELGRATTYAFNVIDLRDRDSPSLIRPVYELPDDNFLAHGYFVRGSTIYTTELEGEALFTSEVDFRDPAAPVLSTRHVVTGRIVAATEQDIYTGPRDYNQSDFTLTRVRCCNDSPDPQPLAARTWPGRTFSSIVSDASGHLFLFHSTTEPNTQSQANWARLEVLDQLTLTTLSTLDIDVYGDAKHSPSEGRLLVDGPDVLYLVDVRTPEAPRMQAAVPDRQGAVLFERAQLVVSDEHGFRSYPATLENMNH